MNLIFMWMDLFMWMDTCLSASCHMSLLFYPSVWDLTQQSSILLHSFVCCGIISLCYPSIIILHDGICYLHFIACSWYFCFTWEMSIIFEAFCYWCLVAFCFIPWALLCFTITSMYFSIHIHQNPNIMQYND